MWVLYLIHQKPPESSTKLNPPNPYAVKDSGIYPKNLKKT
jgi:hypothetical protein